MTFTVNIKTLDSKIHTKTVSRQNWFQLKNQSYRSNTYVYIGICVFKFVFGTFFAQLSCIQLLERQNNSICTWLLEYGSSESQVWTLEHSSTKHVFELSCMNGPDWNETFFCVHIIKALRQPFDHIKDNLDLFALELVILEF